MKSNTLQLETLKFSHKEIGVSKHLHITHLNESTVFECDNGQLGSVLFLQGVSFDTATESELNHYRRIKHQAITMLGELFCIYEHTFRQKLDMKLTGKFEEPFTQTVDELYTAHFKQQNLYRNNLYITLLYKGVDSSKFGKSLNLFQRLNEKAVKGARQQYRIKAIGQLKKAINQLKSLLSQFKPIILGSRDQELGMSEVICFFSKFVNNFDDIRFKAPFYSEPVKKSIHIKESDLKKYPQGNIAYYLPNKRLYFGD